MHVVSTDSWSRPRVEQGPAIYLGYCNQQRRYRLMHLADYVSNVQDGVSRMMSDASNAYQDVARGYGRYQTPAAGVAAKGRNSCAHDCHCDCCVCDADVLVQARCGEIRRIPVTFSNDTRRERPIKLALEKFATSGGRALDWQAKLSETEFILQGCEERTVVVHVEINCGDREQGKLDECLVGYGHLRAEGCLIRPVVVAVAVLPNDCDAYKPSCQCGCCD